MVSFMMPIDKLFAYNFCRILDDSGMTRERAAEKGDVTVSYINGVCSGHKHFGTRAQQKWARIFGVDYREFHRPMPGEEIGIPVIAYVSAGGGLIPSSADQYPVGVGFEYAELPAGYTREQAMRELIYAVKVRGDSMYPTLKDGWILYIKPEPSKILKVDDIVIFKDDHDMAWVKEIEHIDDEQIIFRSIGKGPTIIKRRDEIAVIEKVFSIKL